MASLVGQRIGKYQIEGLIGRGGMGIVYRAVDLALQRPVALKLFQAAGGPDLMTRFRREAQIMAALEHPHIVPIYEIGEWQEQPFIVMRLVEGRSLAQIIAQEGPLPLARVAHIATQVASALDYAHSRGVVHRDVKPSNVLVTSGDQAILTDFGIARAQGWGSLTQTGMVMGSPEYMSPEQITGHSVGPAADIYALGCVVYQLLTGHAPFERDTPSAVLYAHEHHPPQPLRQVNPRVPSAVEGIVLQALAKDPARR
ncbi:MAG: serine/threonine protein kinase [Anaerolineae bacterium]|nr:serine/threonine protein kinase [Anaerolineae bacterium]